MVTAATSSLNTISVLVAAYRAQAWLPQCLRSILEQQLPPGWRLELIVGVDGCRRTLSSLSALTKREFTTISLAENYGTYITFNTLVPYSSGRLLARFDADDVMLSGYLSAHIKRIEQGAEMTHSWSIYTDPQLLPTSHVIAHTHYHPAGGLNRRASEGQFVLHRKLWDSLGGFRSWRCAADTDFLQRAQEINAKIELLEEFLYLRRTHPTSLTAHPQTNFASPLRRKYQQQATLLADGYLRGNEKVLIEPVVGRVSQLL